MTYPGNSPRIMCARMRAGECVSVRRERERERARHEKKERRAETEIDIVLRQRQEKQEYRGNKTNLT